MFNYQERMLAVVPRWSVLPRLTEQNVAMHSYYVALYTDQLCHELEWEPLARLQAVRFALVHDMPEHVTGDIIGPTKYKTINRDTLRIFEEDIMRGLGPYHSISFSIGLASDIRDIVKAANIIDEYFQLSMEASLGNQSVIQLKSAVFGRMRRALNKIELPRLWEVILGEAEKMKEGVGYIHNMHDYDYDND